MRAGVPQVEALRFLTRDGWILFGTRFLRLFAYGLISVVLVLYLADLRFSDTEIGGLLSLTLVGDTIVSLGITTRADRLGARLHVPMHESLLVGVVQSVGDGGDQFGGFPILEPLLLELRREISAFDVF